VVLISANRLADDTSGSHNVGLLLYESVWNGLVDLALKDALFMLLYHL
jgi:hypothetical protein